MKPGELFTERYKKLQMNLPIPWIGMPVWYKPGRFWLVVNGVNCGYAECDGISLVSYLGTCARNSFLVPGQPDTPEMPTDVIDRIDAGYYWGIGAKLVNGVWQRVELLPTRENEMHTVLILPLGESIETVFPNNAPLATEEKNLKQLNTDGRTSCASCGGPLTSLWIGNTNLSHCPKCEP